MGEDCSVNRAKINVYLNDSYIYFRTLVSGIIKGVLYAAVQEQPYLRVLRLNVVIDSLNPNNIDAKVAQIRRMTERS